MSESGFGGSDVVDAGGTREPGFARGAAITWLASSVAALVVSVLAMKMIFKGVMTVELLAGYGLALVNAAAALIINIAAMKRKREGLVVHGIAGNVLRAGTVLAIILLIRLSAAVMFEPFIVAFLAGYFIFMAGEIVWLNKLSAKGKRETCPKP